MNGSYLDVTFRRGKPIVAYYYLPRRAGQRCHSSRPVEGGMIVDLTRTGRPLGIEITAPAKTTLAALNRVLRGLGLPPATRAELAPLHATTS
jgi:hypothetical protein